MAIDKSLFEKNGKLISRRCTEKWILGNNLLPELIKKTSFLPVYSDTIYRLQVFLNDRTSIPKCKTCGSDVPPHLIYCSLSCNKERSHKISVSKEALNHHETNEKRKNTMLKKYGVGFNLQRKEIKDKISTNKLLPEVLQKLNDREWLETEYVVKDKSSVDIAKDLDIYYGTVLWHLRKHGFDIKRTSNYSLYEVEIQEFLKVNNIPFVPHHYLGSFELDIFIPKHKLAIEFNGLYWHSADCHDKTNVTRHIHKTKVCEENGIHLLHIFEDEWLNKKDIWKSIILSKCGLFNARVFARKCQIKTIEPKEAKVFLQENHLQGSINGQHIGLFHQNVLVQMITIGKGRFDKDQMELLRMCTLKNHQVVGGASKLIKSVKMTLVSYADRRYSSRYNVYGSPIKETSPGYFWTDKKTRLSRYSCQKKKLEKLLPVFDMNLSEAKNMFNNGYRIIYDSGHFKYIIA